MVKFDVMYTTQVFVYMSSESYNAGLSLVGPSDATQHHVCHSVCSADTSKLFALQTLANCWVCHLLCVWASCFPIWYPASNHAMRRSVKLPSWMHCARLWRASRGDWDFGGDACWAVTGADSGCSAFSQKGKGNWKGLDTQDSADSAIHVWFQSGKRHSTKQSICQSTPVCFKDANWSQMSD